MKQPNLQDTAYPVPAYWRVTEDLRRRVLAHEWANGVLLPSLRDLAKSYGVGMSTVHRAVNDLVKEGVLFSNGKRGLTVNPAQPSMASEQAGTVISPQHPHLVAHKRPPVLGIVAPVGKIDYDEVWTELIVRAMEQAFSSYGGETRFINLAPNHPLPWKEPEDGITETIDLGVDALAFVDIYGHETWAPRVATVLESLRPLPTIYVSYGVIPFQIPHVFYDNHFGGYQAIRHLQNNGYRRVAFYTPFTSDWLTKRELGARMAADLCDVYASYPDTPSIDWTEYKHFTDEEVCQSIRKSIPRLMEQLSSDNTPGTKAIIVPNDKVGLNMLHVFNEMDITPGQDIGIISFDDGSQARSLGLSSLRPPCETIGEATGRLLYRALSGEPLPMQSRYNSYLLPRASTCRVSPER